MKIKISYFYQIRHFSKNMVPMSTAIWDPQWYHAGLGPDHIYYDKRGILNGLRLKPIITKAQGLGLCPCENKNPAQCKFLQEYRKCLDKVDFNKMMAGIRAFADQYKKENYINEEIIMVLIVYETPLNPCSERQALVDYFKKNGVNCEEWTFPQIKLNKNIDKGVFDF